MEKPNLKEIISRLLDFTDEVSQKPDGITLDRTEALNHANDIRLLVWAFLEHYRNKEEN